MKTSCPLEMFKAIPIDGIHDLCIYYEPIIAASYVGADGHVPAYNTDFSYYIDHFKNVQVGGKGTLYDEMKKTNVQFVHEVQHWLSSELNDNGLKINISFIIYNGKSSLCRITYKVKQ